MGSSGSKGERRKAGRPRGQRITIYGCPPCTDQKTYERWRNTPRASGANAMAAGFCTDCTPEYQAKLVGEGRCDHPEIQFRKSPDGFIDGYLPAKAAR